MSIDQATDIKEVVKQQILKASPENCHAELCVRVCVCECVSLRLRVPLSHPLCTSVCVCVRVCVCLRPKQ